MPTVRFGPDIADDAAYLQNQILDALDMEDALKDPAKAARYSKRERERIRRNAASARRWAKEIFGVTDAEITSRKMGLLGKIASYSRSGRRVSTRRWDPKTGRYKYETTTRKKLKREGGELMRRTVSDEFARREGKDKAKPSGRKSRPAAGKLGNVAGTDSYTGYTLPKGLRSAQAQVLRNLRRKGGKVTIGKKTVKVRTITDLDNIGIAKRAPVGSQKVVRDASGKVTRVTKGARTSIRPRKAKSAKQASRRQRQRASTVAKAGRKAGKQSTAKGRRKR